MPAGVPLSWGLGLNGELGGPENKPTSIRREREPELAFCGEFRLGARKAPWGAAFKTKAEDQREGLEEGHTGGVGAQPAPRPEGGGSGACLRCHQTTET